MSSDGELYVIAAPSGAGKTSLINSLLEAFPNLAFSVSDTTRPARRGEADGEHYHFIDPETFRARREAGRYLEHAQVFGNFYGTDRVQVEAHWAAGRDVLLEIDVQGAAQIRESHPDACQIFILPPSAQALKQRLEKRGLDQPEVIARRLEEARHEIADCHRFDWLVVNDDFDQARRELQAILTAWPLRRGRQADRQSDRIRDLLEAGAEGSKIED